MPLVLMLSLEATGVVAACFDNGSAYMDILKMVQRVHSFFPFDINYFDGGCPQANFFLKGPFR